MEPSTISGLSADGSALDAEPSMMQSVFVDGSPNSFAQTPESGDTATVGCGQGLRTGFVDRVCGQGLRTGFADRAPGPGYNMRLKDAYGQKTDEAANRHYSGLQPQ